MPNFCVLVLYPFQKEAGEQRTYLWFPDNIPAGNLTVPFNYQA